MDDPALQMILADFEILSGADIFGNSRCNLLVSDISKHDDDRIYATVLESPFGHLRHPDNFGFCGYVATDKSVLVECDKSIMHHLLQNQRLLLYNFELTSGRDPIPPNAFQVKKGQHGIFIPWDHSISSAFWICDFFAGGYGGWSYALRSLTEKISLTDDAAKFPHHYVVSIECDLPSATQHAINHQEALIPDVVLPFDFLEGLKHSAVIQAMVQSPNWKQAVAMIRPEIWTLSFPCQSWSESSTAKGFGDMNGRSFAYSLGLLRIFRPKFCLLENVKGFQVHHQYEYAMKLVHWAGYRILHQAIYDAADHLPIRRPRYLAMLSRLEDPKHEHKWLNWGLATDAVPLMWDAWSPTKIEDFPPFVPSPVAKGMYLHPQFLSNRVPAKTKDNILAYRVPSPSKKLPVMMAAYGEHHMLPVELLRAKGLQGFFTSEHGTFRWFKPVEMALYHLQIYPMALLKPAKLAWHSLGNSIVHVHALLALANLFAIQFGCEDSNLVQNMVAHMTHTRLRMRTVVPSEDEFAWYIGQSEDNQELKLRVNFLVAQLNWEGKEPAQWPADTYFHPQNGLVSLVTHLAIQKTQLDISPTIPFVLQENSLDLGDKPIENCLEDVDQTESPRVAPLEEVTVTLGFAPHGYGHFKVHLDPKWIELLALWDFDVVPKFLTMEQDQLMKCVQTAILVPKNSDSETFDFHSLIGSKVFHFIVDDENLTHILIKHEGDQYYPTIADIINLTGEWSDDYGSIPNKGRIQRSSRIWQSVCLIDVYHDFWKFLEATTQIGLETRIPKFTDILQVTLTGPSEDLVQVVAFWKTALNTHWQSRHGRRMVYQVVDENTILLVFLPVREASATPARMFRDLLEIRLTRVAMQSFAEFTDPPERCIVKLKLDHRNIGEFVFQSTQNIAQLYLILDHTLSLTCFGDSPAIIFRGRRLGDIVDFGSLAIETDQYVVKLHIVRPLRGGGFGAKQQHKQAVHSALAALLLEEGCTIDQVAKSVPEMISQLGHPRLSHFLFSEDPAKRQQTLHHLCKTCEIELPKKPVKLSKVQSKFQKIAHDHQQRANKHFDVTQYRLMPDFFCLSDGTSAPIHSIFSPCVPGITMVNAEVAKQWLQHGGKLLPDELALFIVGNVIDEKDTRLTKLVAPALNDKGEKVLIAGWLMQLGEKLIKTATEGQSTVQTLDVSTDFDQSLWKEIVSAPVKHAKKILEKDQLHQVILNPWGRTFRQGRQPSPPELATSVQFHTEVRIQDLRNLLRRSGFNGIYVTPKDSQGRPDAMWKVVWTDLPVSILEAKTTPVSGMAGLVRGNKSIGIRTETSAFSTIWELLNPGQPLPDIAPNGEVWKLHPLPVGINKEIIAEWAQLHKWECFPIRAVSGRAWLVHSPTNPPSDVLHFNGSPIVVKKVQSRGPEQAVGLIAGPKSSPQKMDEVVPANTFRIGDPFHDPWSGWKPSSGATASSMPKTESIVGPTASKFDHQDQQIKSLEAAIEKIQIHTDKKNAEMEERLSNMDQKIHHNHEQVQQSFQALRGDFETTLHRALAVQDNKITNTMEEIKQLFLRGPKRKEPTDDDELQD